MGISTWPNARDHVGWTKCSLFNILEVVVWIAVEGQPPDRSQRIILVWPHPCNVKWVTSVCLGFLWAHDLQMHDLRGKSPRSIALERSSTW